MITSGTTNKDLGHKIQKILAKEPGLSVKDLASGLGVNRQFMAGYLTALEERGEVYHRQVGPARIYFLGRQMPVRTNEAKTKNSKTPKGINSL
jgi:predicted transcriptional regulator